MMQQTPQDYTVLNRISPEDNLMAMNDLNMDLDTTDLSEWIDMEQQHESNEIFESLPPNNLKLECDDDSLSFEKNFQNCAQEESMEDDSTVESVCNHNMSIEETKHEPSFENARNFSSHESLSSVYVTPEKRNRMVSTSSTHPPTAILGATVLSTLGGNEQCAILHLII